MRNELIALVFNAHLNVSGLWAFSHAEKCGPFNADTWFQCILLQVILMSLILYSMAIVLQLFIEK